jgi:hypothetical protein
MIEFIKRRLSAAGIGSVQVTKLSISVVAVVALALHLFVPALKLDLAGVALIVIGVIPWLRTSVKSVKLPGFEFELFEHQPVDSKKRVLESEVSVESTSAASNKETQLPQRPTTPAPTAMYLQAEDLALRVLEEQEFDGPIQRQRRLKVRKDLQFDGLGWRRGVPTLIEVKYLVRSGQADDAVHAALARLTAVNQELRRTSVGSREMQLLLAVVTSASQEACYELEGRLRERWGKERSLDIRVFQFDALLRRFT